MLALVSVGPVVNDRVMRYARMILRTVGQPAMPELRRRQSRNRSPAIYGAGSCDSAIA